MAWDRVGRGEGIAVGEGGGGLTVVHKVATRRFIVCTHKINFHFGLFGAMVRGRGTYLTESVSNMVIIVFNNSNMSRV